jgi:aminopeptidase N
VFNPNVYYGGALVLYALRIQVGDATFRQIERTWVARYRGRSPSTEDFIALASQVSGQDLSGFLHAWLYGQTMPPMPGHPDWTTRPVPVAPLAARIAPEELLPASLPRIWRH